MEGLLRDLDTALYINTAACSYWLKCYSLLRLPDLAASPVCIKLS